MMHELIDEAVCLLNRMKPSSASIDPARRLVEEAIELLTNAIEISETSSSENELARLQDCAASIGIRVGEEFSVSKIDLENEADWFRRRAEDRIAIAKKLMGN